MSQLNTVGIPVAEPGMAFGLEMANAIGSSFPDDCDRIKGLWGCSEALKRELRSAALEWVKKTAPDLARIELEYTKAFDRDGIANLELDILTLITVSGEGWSFGFYEEVECAAELAGLDDFRESLHRNERGGCRSEQPVVQTLEADRLWAWIGAKYGVSDWVQFWEVLWMMFESDKEDTGPFVLREMDDNNGEEGRFD